MRVFLFMKEHGNQHCFVVLAYKDSPYLSKCIESLLKQTIKSDLLISTSTPSSYIEKIAKQYQIPIVISPGGSIGVDWNYAYHVSKNSTFCFYHSG